MRELRRLHEAGELSSAAQRYFAPQKPVEELYDCDADPHELSNIAGDPNFAAVLKRLRERHLAWVRDTKDVGLIPEPVIAQLEKEVGSPYAILRSEGGDALAERIARVAELASSGAGAAAELSQLLKDSHPAVRYWAATGLGNIGIAAENTAAEIVREYLSDPSPAVSIAAARALCRMNQPAPAVSVLARHLLDGEQWEQLQAAIVLDEIDAQAKPVMGEMKRALDPNVAKNKYVVRVINRAMNEQLGTDNQVK